MGSSRLIITWFEAWFLSYYSCTINPNECQVFPELFLQVMGLLFPNNFPARKPRIRLHSHHRRGSDFQPPCYIISQPWFLWSRCDRTLLIHLVCSLAQLHQVQSILEAGVGRGRLVAEHEDIENLAELHTCFHVFFKMKPGNLSG